MVVANLTSADKRLVDKLIKAMNDFFFADGNASSKAIFDTFAAEHVHKFGDDFEVGQVGQHYKVQ